MIGRTSRHPCHSAGRILAAALFVFSIPAFLQARQDTPSGQAPPGIEVKIQAHPLQATVGDPIQIDLDVALPPGYRLRFPSLPAQLGDFSILDVNPGPSVPAAQPAGNPPAGTRGVPAGTPVPGAGRHQARLAVAVYKPGEFDFPPLTLTATDPEGKETQVSTPTVRIQIESVLEHEEQKLRDLKQQAEIEEPSRWLWWLALALPVLALAAFLVRRRLKRSPEPALEPATRPAEDPLDAAEAALRALVERGLPERGLVKDFYVQLSGIVKGALESSYVIQTVEKTTTEMIDALASAPSAGRPFPGRDGMERIETLLLSCDMVKFARYIPSGAENEAAAGLAFQVFADCRSTRQIAGQGVAPAAGGS